jgi:hypothetical protein
LTPERLLPRFARLLRRTQAPYTPVSRDPAIFYVQLAQDTLAEFLEQFEMVLRALRGQPLYLLCCHGAMDDGLLEGSVQLEAQCAAAFPDVRLIHLCNEEESVEGWTARGLQAIHCNHNAFLDERIFRPLEGARPYEAVYDARLAPFKRHSLAAQIQQLALIYYVVPLVDDMDYAHQLKRDFEKAHFFNLESGAYRLLGHQDLNRCLNQCQVGLCLSDAEGAMYASGQYLLSGLGVVSTPSRGGRDCFWDARIAITVEATAEAVRDGVAEIKGRRLDPWEVHQATLERMQHHRQRFFDLVNRIRRSHGHDQPFEEDWPRLFFNRFLRNQNHRDTLDWLCGAAGRP